MITFKYVKGPLCMSEYEWASSIEYWREANCGRNSLLKDLWKPV